MPEDKPEVEIDKGRKLRLVEDRVRNPGQVLARIGRMVANRAQAAFRLQKRGEDIWPPRGVPNIAGILSDLEKGSSVKKRRFDDRPAGVDTGRLRQSIAWTIIDSTTVEIGTVVEYASKIQFGGEEVIPITKEMKDGLAKFIGEDPELSADLGFLLKADEYKVNIPPRPFVVVTVQDEEDIRTIVVASIAKPDAPPPAPRPGTDE